MRGPLPLLLFALLACSASTPSDEVRFSFGPAKEPEPEMEPDPQAPPAPALTGPDEVSGLLTATVPASPASLACDPLRRYGRRYSQPLG